MRKRESFFRKRIFEGEIRTPFNGKIISNISLREKAFVKEGDFLSTPASEDSLGEARQALKAPIRPDSLPSSVQNGMSATVTIEAEQESLLRRCYHELF